MLVNPCCIRARKELRDCKGQTAGMMAMRVCLWLFSSIDGHAKKGHQFELQETSPSILPYWHLTEQAEWS